MRPGDREVLRRNTVLWILAASWVLASFLLQDPPKDEYDGWFRGVATIAFALVIPAVSAAVLYGWWRAIRRK